MKIGSLFTGYGGLDTAVEAVTGGRTVWVSDNDPGAAKILAHNQPRIPNLGDLTRIDWTAVDPVDVITGGFPCQDLSIAGKRGGMAGARSGLWSHMATAVDVLRPGLVVVENVRGLLSAEANSAVEPCPWCVGDRPTVDMRALGAVLADLADVGYDAAWCGLTAASVGAPHGRFRVFVVAWDTSGDNQWDDGKQGSGGPRGAQQPAGGPDSPAANTDGVGHERGWRTRHRRPGPADRGLAAADAAGIGRGAAGRDNGLRPAGLESVPAADTEGDGRLQGWPEPAGQLRGPDAAVRSDATPSDAISGGRDGWPRNEVGTAERGAAAARRGQVDWGDFTPAIRQWEHLMGREAPPPTGIGAKGGHSLAPTFCEWMMGLPAGHVTAVPGLTRNEQLKALGNGVVPQQAEAALRYLLSILCRVGT